MKYDDADPFRMSLPKGLFLLVPPRSAEPDLDRLMEAVEVKGKKGINHIRPKGIVDMVAIPKGPYLVIDFEEGMEYLNVQPSFSETNIIARDRSPFTVLEGIFHGIVFPELLTSVNLLGSRYGENGVPGLYLGSEPELFAHLSNDANPEWGAPSCARRVGA
jgi:hypothetical protein